jgi:uncharacterized protein YegL
MVHESAQVTITLAGQCPNEPKPASVVLVLDRSRRMQGDGLRELKWMASDFVRRLMRKGEHSKLVGVVSFSHEARIDMGLTEDSSSVLSAIANLRAGGGTSIDMAIDKARGLLRASSRRDWDYGAGPWDFIVVVSHGRNDAGAERAVAAAGRARAQGAIVVAVCATAQCDADTMRRLNSMHGRFLATHRSSLQRWADGLANWYSKRSVMEMWITQTLGASMRLAAGSAVPPASDYNGSAIAWHLESVPWRGVTVTYQIEPLAPGAWPVSDRSEVTLLDRLGRWRTLALPSPELLVLGQPAPGPRAIMPNTLLPGAAGVANGCRHTRKTAAPLQSGDPASRPECECLTGDCR